MIDCIINNNQSYTSLMFQNQTSDFVHKVKKISLAALKNLKEILHFPSRYLGSKTFSLGGILFRLPQSIMNVFRRKPFNSPALFCNRGYHPFRFHPISQDEAKKCLIYASAAAAIHNNNTRWLEPFEYKPMDVSEFNVGLENRGTVLFDRVTGLKISLYANNEDVLITFGAQKSHKSQFTNDQGKESILVEERMKRAAIKNLLGGCPTLYQTADRVITELVKHETLKAKKITLCGQCLGGSLSSYVALRQGIPAVALNTFPLGAGLQQKIGTKNLQNADQWVTHLSSKWDQFSDIPPFIKIFDILVNFIGLRTPGNFGKRMRVEAIHLNPSKNHTNILGTLIAKANPQLRTACHDMVSSNYLDSKEAFKVVSSGLNDLIHDRKH